MKLAPPGKTPVAVRMKVFSGARLTKVGLKRIERVGSPGAAAVDRCPVEGRRVEGAKRVSVPDAGVRVTLEMVCSAYAYAMSPGGRREPRHQGESREKPEKFGYVVMFHVGCPFSSVKT